jgi:hypothetical protein
VLTKLLDWYRDALLERDAYRKSYEDSNSAYLFLLMERDILKKLYDDLSDKYSNGLIDEAIKKLNE